MECPETLTRPPFSVVSINSFWISEYVSSEICLIVQLVYRHLAKVWIPKRFCQSLCSLWTSIRFTFQFAFKAFPLHPYLLGLKVSNFLWCKKKTRPSIESSPSFDHAAVFVRPAFLILKRFCFGESRFSHQAPRRDGGIKKCLSQLAARGRGWWEWALHL